VGTLPERVAPGDVLVWGWNVTFPEGAALHAALRSEESPPRVLRAWDADADAGAWNVTAAGVLDLLWTNEGGATVHLRYAAHVDHAAPAPAWALPMLAAAALARRQVRWA
jgi:hypothetical protein